MDLRRPLLVFFFFQGFNRMPRAWLVGLGAGETDFLANGVGVIEVLGLGDGGMEFLMVEPGLQETL